VVVVVLVVVLVVVMVLVVVVVVVVVVSCGCVGGGASWIAAHAELVVHLWLHMLCLCTSADAHNSKYQYSCCVGGVCISAHVQPTRLIHNTNDNTLPRQISLPCQYI
jgi:hypothetical protein